MSAKKVAVTIDRPLAEVRRLCESPDQRPDRIHEADATVTFLDAPGDRGTEIHVELTSAPGKVGGAVRKLTGRDALAQIKDELRRFKQRVETGQIPRSEATPEGERVERKLKQRPAQPLSDTEREQVGAR
jgi:hypothetical protein